FCSSSVVTDAPPLSLHDALPILCGLAHAPIFCPIVSDFYSGMVVTVPLFSEELPAGVTADHLRQCYGDTYRGPVVRYLPQMDEEDRKSTRLNSSHVSISYAVFCL